MINVLNMVNNLYNSDNIDNLIIECIDANLDNEVYPLSESIELFPKLSEYAVLIESADAVIQAKKDLAETKEEKDPEEKANLLSKLTRSIRNAFNWWYKVEPNKKYKTLHTILKILSEVLGIIFLLYAPGKKAIIKNVAARLAIGYEGDKKIPKALFSKSVLAALMVATIYGQIYKALKNLNKKAEYVANIKDIDKAIEEYDKSIEDINKMIEDVYDPQIKMNLEKAKKDMEDALATLIKIKERHEKENKKKDKND